ncbi:MAG: amino acid transporter substrate-binding protein branched-chain amino acid transport system [Candidatus Nomurabacteria bacterium]|nr:amino acid transporter substrate-binding protein branched-chain amino acid transport system [Candidatus Nomurabacteria bacterium]
MKKPIIWGLVVIVILAGLIIWKIKHKEEIAISIIKVGSILPLSGDFAPFGEEILRGEQIALAEAKNAGLNVEFLSEDDQSAPNHSVSAANKLVRNDKVNAVLTATMQEMKPIENTFKSGSTPLLVTWDSNDYIKNSSKNIFTIGFSTESAGRLMADYAFNTLKLRNVAVINVLDDWSSIIANSFIDEFKKVGGNITFNEQVAPDQKDFRTQIAKIKSTNADGIYAPLFPTTIAPFVRQLRELNSNAIFMTADSFTQDEANAAGTASEGVYFTNLYANDTRDLNIKYKSMFGKEPGASVFVSFGYDGIRTIIEAARIAKSDNITIRDAMTKVNISGTDTKINFNGKQFSEKIEKLYKIQNGQIIEVK